MNPAHSMPTSIAFRSPGHHPRDPHPQRRQRVESTCLIDSTKDLHAVLHQMVVGQDASVDRIICSFARVLFGLRDPGRPLLTMLLLGPTGVGKTETAKALARTLFGSERSMTRINAEEYAHGHEISKLLGSPPGYVGHQIEPLLSQERLDQACLQAIEQGAGLVGTEIRDGSYAGLDPRSDPISILLVDEVEKADPRLWNALLGILEDGTLTLGDNRTTNFTNTIILMTSNVGSREMGEMLHHRRVGFRTEELSAADDAPSGSLQETARRAAYEVFPAEFLNRFDDVLVYSPLEADHLLGIFDKFLADIQQRVVTSAGVPLLLRVSEAARAWLVERGTDPRLGARPLRRVMEVHIVDALSRLIGARKVIAGDIVEFDLVGGSLATFRVEDDPSIFAGTAR